MSVSKAEIEQIIQLVSDGNVESLSAQDFEQFQYQGFDPFKIVASLIKVKKDKSISNADFQKNVATMVAVGMIKGNVNSHNLTKMSDEGKKQLTDLMATYGIKQGGGKGQPAGVITFPRMMATFPDISIRLVNVIGAKEFRGGPMISTRLPAYLQVQVFPAIIPKDVNKDLKKILLVASLCYSIDQTIQISRLQNPDLKQLAATQANFTNLGHSSPVPSEDIRKSVFSTLSLADDYDKIATVLATYKEKIESDFVILTKDQFTKML